MYVCVCAFLGVGKKARDIKRWRGKEESKKEGRGVQGDRERERERERKTESEEER